MCWVSCAPHHVNITQAVDPEGVQGRRDGVELISFKDLLTLSNRAVESGADPAVHAAQRSCLQRGKHCKRLQALYTVMFIMPD